MEWNLSITLPAPAGTALHSHTSVRPRLIHITAGTPAQDLRLGRPGSDGPADQMVLTHHGTRWPGPQGRGAGQLDEGPSRPHYHTRARRARI